MWIKIRSPRADGHLTVIVLTRSTNTDQVRLVGDHVPQSSLGNPAMRFITLLTFTKKHSRATQLLFNVLARRRLDAEARRLQSRYAAKNLTRNPRSDVFAVLDFDGSISARLEMAPTIPFQVVVLGRKGELLKRWDAVPSAPELSAVLE